MEHAIVREAAIEDAHALALVHMNSSRVAYRDLVPGDAPSLEALEREWSTALGDPHVTVFSAAVGVQVVGTVLVRPSDASHVAELQRLYVAPELWGLGIGNLLHDAAVEELGKQFGAAELWVFEENDRARRFYERRGWLLMPDAVLEWPTMPVREVRYRLPVP